jgi:low affinity Fe/Cu permease
MNASDERNLRGRNNREHWFSKIATETATSSGRPWAFGIAGGFVIGWLVTGPVFHFSDTWQLVMNTISSELIRVTEARNQLMGIEELSEPELETVRDELQAAGDTKDRSPAASISGQPEQKRTKTRR